MKKLISALIIVAILLIAGFSGVVVSEAASRANPVFDSGSVYLSNTFKAEFTASTNVVCSFIYVSSCTLQKKVGTTWSNLKALAVPSYVATNSSIYGDVKSYGNDIPAGGTYRLKVIFSGGGETLTRYSNSQSK